VTYPGPYADLGEVCPCEPMPVMWWRFPGEGWEVMYSLGEDRDPEADGAAYLELGAVGWCIQCPECLRVYKLGMTLG